MSPQCPHTEHLTLPGWGEGRSMLVSFHISPTTSSIQYLILRAHSHHIRHSRTWILTTVLFSQEKTFRLLQCWSACCMVTFFFACHFISLSAVADELVRIVNIAQHIYLIVVWFFHLWWYECWQGFKVKSTYNAEVHQDKRRHKKKNCLYIMMWN